MANPHGAVAYFDSPEKILMAAKAAKKQKLKNYESFTPFPVHGMEEALGLKLSIVPWATFICGLGGFLAATMLQVWTSAIDWPLNIGGKPFLSIPAFIPVMFELTVLFGGLGTIAFLFFLIGLPSSKKPFHPKITDDRFALYVPFEGQTISRSQVEGFLKSQKPESVDLLVEPL